ncbi:MAG TPA: molybdopterin-synthase adenylyltransferase MoeB [Gemmatimonadaceae bacterium]|nr:molybdopterin-synthase adenylyltransferase MoeB [Gemmatimonadaceae bacterium]
MNDMRAPAVNRDHGTGLDAGRSQAEPSYAGAGARGNASALSAGELSRYGRHLSLAEIGASGQERLKSARVLVVGAGGLGSPASMYLAAAGVGTIGLVDFDEVERSNLQRQILFGETDVGRLKLEAASDRLSGINPHLHLEPHETRLSARNAERIVGGYDVVVDGTDNFATRYLVNDVCVHLGVPNVYGSVLRFEGQASVFATPEGPCYRCLFREPPPPGLVPSCAEAGVMGVLPGIIGSIQAAETIKLITGAGRSLAGRLLLLDALTMTFRSIEIRRDPGCPACGTRQITVLRDYDEYCDGRTAGGDAHGALPPEIAPADLAARLERGDSVTLLDVREEVEWRIGHIAGARLVPLGEISGALGSIPAEHDVVVYCHHGTRSRAATELLSASGFRASNLAGGIDRWSREVDPSVPRY